MTRINYDDRVQTRIAFANRRERLIGNWLLSREAGNADNMAHWAVSIEQTNDAEIAVFTALGAF